MRYATFDNDPRIIDLSTGDEVQKSGYRVVRRQGSSSWLLILTLDGAGDYRHPGGQFTSGVGDATLLTPRTMHEYAIHDDRIPWGMIWSHFHARPHWHPFLKWKTVCPGVQNVRLEEETFESVKRLLLTAHERSSRFDPALAMVALEEALIVCSRASAQSGPRDPRVEQAIDFVLARLSEPIEVADIAKEIGLSVSRFSHLFREQLGQPPRDFIERQRLSRACQLLATSPNLVREIAEMVGFQSEFYFSLRFRKLTGLSPSQFRQAAQRAPDG